MKKIKLIFIMLSFLVASIAIAAENPVPMLQNVANNIIDNLKQHKSELKTNQAIIQQAVRSNLLPHVDVAGMARSVLGRSAWIKATSAEKQQFASAFTDLVIRTYASPLSKYTDETVSVSPVKAMPTGRFMRVSSTIIRSQGKSIPLTYSLVNKNGQWKIYDLSVEGVSLLQSFRSQFANALSHSSIKEVIAQMQSPKQAG